ncbi:MAG: ABC transporter permease [Patescibacteria group bacterium]
MTPQLNILFNAFTLILASTLRMSTPLTLTALGGMFSERTGVVNVGLEGIMLMGAFSAMAGSYLTGQPWLGFLLGTIVGGVFALIHAVASIHLRGNQVVSGMALNVLAMALTGFLLRRLFQHAGHSPQVASLPEWNFLPVFGLCDGVPILRNVLGSESIVAQVIGRGTPPIYLCLILVVASHYVLFHTPLGMRLRAVGEHPEAAESLGISVYGLRYLGVILSGLLGGMGGATLSVGLLNSFGENMTTGRGFIALAAMNFGKWRPYGALRACLIFGFFVAFEMQAQSLASLSVFFPWLKVFSLIPREVFLGLPYVATILILAGFIGRSTPPAASGLPYEGRK